MDGDEGYDVDEEKYDIEDCRCPSKVSLIVMMILFMTMNDNFDDDEKVEPGNYVGHEPHSASPLQVAGGTTTPCMVIGLHHHHHYDGHLHHYDGHLNHYDGHLHHHHYHRHDYDRPYLPA